ncbi:ABC superfamily ATP binding cassette transporter, ABC protein [Weissella koreensis KCTC 3621]|uniref:ABC transporter ATP-binding protein n=1 Tax=Weissella koreensis TaxID=165096 RepID=UPI00026F30A0|nr:ATP-binding cassette domain-containing protein [Weissella koreensis]EJF33636.1 ABC superfamily ATP binding cassette transporter, ABC protein [Weissella koreensis KCTC 3621]
MLTVKNVDVFIGKKMIVNHATFDVGKGKVVGLIGPNGAGKTTIMKTILGLSKFKGEIQLNSLKISESNHHALKNVGALIEHPAIYPFMSGYQNLRLYSKDNQHLHDLIDLLDMGQYINRKSKGYSLGMKQKLGIAIALTNNPEFVILDEPMNGLDIETTISIRNIIKKYANNGTSFLISSHILSELEKVITDVILINNGQILIEKPIEYFNQNNYNSYQLETSDPVKTSDIFQKKIIFSKINDTTFLISKKQLYQVQDILKVHNIYILKLIQNKLNFEQQIIKLLNQQRDTQS